MDPDFGALDLGAVFQKGANIKAKQLVGEGMYVFVEMTVVGPRDGEWLGRVEEARKEIVRRVEGEGYQVMGFDLKEEGDGDLDRVEELS